MGPNLATSHFYWNLSFNKKIDKTAGLIKVIYILINGFRQITSGAIDI